MGPVSVETLISAPREAVFDFVGDIANHVAFTDHFASEFRLARPRSDGLGAAARFRLDNPGPKQWAEVQFSVFDRPRRIVEEGHSGRFLRNKFWTVWEFIPDGKATRVELTFSSEPATRWDSFKESLGARSWVKRENKMALERLRKVFEESRDRPLARCTVAGLEPLTLPRFGDHPSRERLGAKG
jgi:ribosome-associated toxin RatA of RatAB toxin-antitoxin module